MHIGLVTACYEPVINGVTSMVGHYKAGFEAAGHRVSIFTVGKPTENGSELSIYRSPALPIGQTGYHFGFRYTRDAQRALGEVDIIHCHHLFMGLEFAHRYGRAPIIYTNHTRYDLYTAIYGHLSQEVANKIMRWIWPKRTAFADVIIAPSKSLKRIMLQFGVQRPIQVIENGVQLTKFQHPRKPLKKSDFGISDDDILLIYIGRLSAEKNIFVLLSEFAAAANSLPKLRLMLLGHGPLEAKLRKKVQLMDLKDRVIFAGSVPFGDVSNYLSAADIFVTASLSEVFPLTVIEAMAGGLPIAAIASPGLVDTVRHNITGLLAEKGNGNLAQYIGILTKNDNLRQQMGHQARIFSKNYDIEVTVRRTQGLYERLIHNRIELERVGIKNRAKKGLKRLNRVFD